uniref:Uncharacterized protein n=1 Tax=Anguilla anguilla TaxID=7936 RepID=A0A0E9T1H7_ANGAN
MPQHRLAYFSIMRKSCNFIAYPSTKMK